MLQVVRASCPPPVLKAYLVPVMPSYAYVLALVPPLIWQFQCQVHSSGSGWALLLTARSLWSGCLVWTTYLHLHLPLLARPSQTSFEVLLSDPVCVGPRKTRLHS